MLRRRFLSTAKAVAAASTTASTTAAATTLPPLITAAAVIGGANAVGFGISNPEQAAEVARNAEAVVVGSAIVNQIAAKGRATDLVSTVKTFTANLINGIR